MTNYSEYQKIILNSRQLYDLELILNGGFYPLNGYLKKNDYISVLNNMRLVDGSIWSIPIVLSIPDDKIINNSIQKGNRLTLTNDENLPIAILDVESIYKPDLIEECIKIFGCCDDNHPYMKLMLENPNIYYIGGKVDKIRLPLHYDFIEYRMSPIETKKFFKESGWKKIVGFQTRNPIHRSHFELTKYAMEKGDAKLFLNPVVGVTQDCDVNYHNRVKCYIKIMKYYNKNTAKLCLLPLSMRMAGPREAVWHAIIRKNYGCTHFVVGRDHAGPSYKKKNGESFYGEYEAQELLQSVSSEIGIELITSKLIVYAIPKNGDIPFYTPIDMIDIQDYEIMQISGTKQREMLRNGTKLPEWFTFPEIEKQLLTNFKSKNNQGFCVYLVGLSGSGKTTIAKALCAKLLELTDRKITILDGDVVRQNLSKGLSFSKDDRSINVKRIGYVASEIVKHNGVVICANIAPYNCDRLYNRNIISEQGNYYEIMIDTSIKECERRDVKGLYFMARSGKLTNFTGISDPFEESTMCDLYIDGNSNNLIKNNVNKIISFLNDQQVL